MDRGEGGDAASSPLETVKDFLVGLGGRTPTRDEVKAIEPELEIIYAKIVRLRTMAPAFQRVDLSDEVWELMSLIGKRSLKNRPPGGLRNAASFL